MQISEDQLIERIRRRIPSSGGGALRLGIGHDAAVIRAGREDWVITCDQFLEGVHFLAGKHPPESVGYKSLIRATSDVVAMSARPCLFLLSLALPAERTGAWLNRMLSGMARASRLLGLRLAGGDTTRIPDRHGTVALNLTVLGQAGRGVKVGRKGAKPGDVIYVTGVLGKAELGLKLVLSGSGNKRKYSKFVAPYFYPTLPLEFALWLGRNRLPTAMMDISDGLSTDLMRLCKSSGVGARVYANHIPAVNVPESLRRSRKFDPLMLALHGGEDYGLLFTLASRKASRMPVIFGGTRITRIGEIVAGSGVSIVDNAGEASPLKPGGWDPFARP